MCNFSNFFSNFLNPNQGGGGGWFGGNFALTVGFPIMTKKR